MIFSTHISLQNAYLSIPKTKIGVVSQSGLSIRRQTHTYCRSYLTADALYTLDALSTLNTLVAMLEGMLPANCNEEEHT